MFYLDLFIKTEENTLSITELTTATTKKDKTTTPSFKTTENYSTDSSISTNSKSG